MDQKGLFSRIRLSVLDVSSYKNMILLRSNGSKFINFLSLYTLLSTMLFQFFFLIIISFFRVYLETCKTIQLGNSKEVNLKSVILAHFFGFN